MGLMETFKSWFARSGEPLSWNAYQDYFTYLGQQYPFTLGGGTLGRKEEEPLATFEGYVQAGYKANGVIFACMMARLLIFSEARFQYRRLRSGRPGELFGGRELGLLERPWPGGTTGDLLGRAIQDADLAGNFYAVRRGNTIKRMRPDWVTIVLGSELDSDDPALALDAEVIGYLYKPGGPRATSDPQPLLPEQVCHFAPIPDPLAHFRGMSWLTPIVREIMADNSTTTHKLQSFESGATPNIIVTFPDPLTREKFKEYREIFKNEYEGTANAYKTMFMAGGATAEVVGRDFRQMDLKAVQGAGETRICAAARVPAVIVGVSEGLQAATYSNYSQARRHFADGTMRPLWRNIAGSMSQIIPVPGDAELWFDDRDIPFLQEDEKDAAEIQNTHAQTISNLIDAGYEPVSVVEAVVAGDLNRLVHTGLVSVQLHTPGAQINGNENGRPVPVEAG